MSTSANAAEPRARGIFALVDDAVFLVERTILSAFLLAMTAIVALDVFHQRLSARESKVADLLARVFGVTDEGTKQALTETWTPALLIVLGVSGVYFAVHAAQMRAEKHTGVAAVAPRAAAILAAVVGLGYMLHNPDIPSWVFCSAFYALVVGGIGTHVFKEKAPRWELKLGALAASLGLVVWVAKNYFPVGYGWSKEFSGALILWVGFLGVSVCAHEGRHIRLEALMKVVPDAAQRYAEALGALLTAAFCLLMAKLGWDYVFDPMLGEYALNGVFDLIGQTLVKRAGTFGKIGYPSCHGDNSLY